MGWSQGTRMAATLGVTVMALISGPTTVQAGPEDFFGPARQSIRGAASSEAPGDDYGLGVWARTSGNPEDAEGQLRFGHRDADGERGMAGEVHCLARDAAGLVQVSGVIFGSGGEDAAGRDFAVTVDVEGSPQRFSGLRLGEPGTVAPCSGGTAEFHTVTRGGYEAG